MLLSFTFPFFFLPRCSLHLENEYEKIPEMFFVPALLARLMSIKVFCYVIRADYVESGFKDRPYVFLLQLLFLASINRRSGERENTRDLQAVN